MAISLTCVCGAVLEIDDKFKGQKLPCPDCNRLLDTNPPPAPPKTTSGWALAALVLPLVGALTLVGPIAGMVCGAIGLRQMRRDPSVGGQRFAQAGIAVGGVFTLLSIFALFGGEFFNIDGFLRVFLYSRDLLTPREAHIRGTPTNQESVTFALTLTDRRGWGIVPVKNTEDGVDLTLINPWLDMQILCFAIVVDEQDDARIKAIQRFIETKLVKDLNAKETPQFPAPEQIKSVGEGSDKGQRQLFEVDLTLGRVPRVFLFRLFPEKSRLNAAVIGCRKGRFAGVEPELHKILETVKLEEPK
jgi:hypothetical protein